MNTHTHPDPALSEKLAALSLAPGAPKSPSARRRGGRVLLGLSCVALVAGGVALLPALVGEKFDDVPADPVGSAASRDAQGAPEPQAPIAGAIAPMPAPASIVTGSGHVIALEQASVHARRGGTIVALHADIGTVVEAGQTLLRLDDPETSFALQAAELAEGRARLTLAASTIDRDEADALADRMKLLAGRGAATAQAAIDAELAAKRAAIAVDQGAQALAEAELSVRRARQGVSELTITAPIAGVVTARSVRLGETILAQIDTRGEAPLFTIVDSKRLAIDVDIAETAIAAMRPGLRGEAVLDGYPDRPFAVEVTRIAPVASSERGTVSVRLSPLTPPHGIRPAMAARVSLTTDTTAAVATIAQGH